MLRYSLIVICTGLLLSCNTSKNSSVTYRDNIPAVSFCDLPLYKGKQVYLKCYYSGIDEYWSLKNIKPGDCNSKLSVDLQFTGYNPFNPPEKFETVFREASENYNTYLLIEAVGIFENGNKNGYGHLGSNNSRFIVSELIKVTLMKK